MSLNTIKKRLKKYTWGLGLEHEMHLFHMKKNRKTNITSFTLYDSELARRRLLDEVNLKDKVKITRDEQKFLSEIPFEKTGRLCNGKWVIKRVPFDMPEFITDHPILGIPLTSKDKSRDISQMCAEIISNKKKFLNLIKKEPITKKQVKKYGELQQYPFGMTSYLKYPEDSNSLKYDFRKDKSGKVKVREEYVGSYHVTMTLPYVQNITTQKEFIELHQNFANQLQWLEPLLLTAFFSCDEKAPGSKLDRVRGSFRVMIIGWGNFAGSDIRKLGKGIGRYSDIPAYWRKGLKFYQTNKLKPCYKPSPYAKKEGGISTLSSNFRTFGDDKRGERVSGAGMTVGNGVEFRIFDQFNDDLLIELVRFVSLVAENSRIHKTKKYVYKNKHWIGALHEIMKKGWCAELKKGYINELRKVLDIKIKTKSVIAYDILLCINDELYEKNKNGDFFIIMNYDEWMGTKKSVKTKNQDNQLKPNLPNVNFQSWMMGCLIKFNRNKNLLNRFNTLVDLLPNKFNEKEFEEYFFRFFDKKNWKRDVVNFMTLLNTLGYVKIYTNQNGTIKYAEVVNRRKINNFNDDIESFFESEFL
jgi:hypothetical protein